MKTALLAALLGLGSQASGAQVDYGGGVGAFPLLNRPAGARGLAMGTAFEAVAEGPDSQAWNPAGLGFASAVELGLSHESLLAGASKESLGALLPLGSLGAIGLSGAWISYPSLDMVDAAGSPLGSYQPSEQALSLAYARFLEKNVSFGIQARGLRQDLPGAAIYGSSFSGGVLARIGMGWSLGGVVKSLPEGRDRYSLNWGLGTAWNSESLLGGPLLASLSARFDRNAPAELNVGVEKGFTGMELLRLRAGYSASFPDPDLGALRGLALGAGFRLGGLNLDYAYLPYGDFGGMQQFSLNWNFQKAPQNSPLDQAAPSKPVEPGTTAILPAAAEPQPPALPEAMASPELQAPLPAPKTQLHYRVLSDDYIRAKAFEEQGLAKDAVAAYVQAVSKDPKDLPAWKALGALYEKLGRPDYARRCHEEAAKLE